MLRDVRRLESNQPVDVGVTGGVIETVAETGTLAGDETVDAGGRLCIPAFVDSHVHLDKAYLAELPGFDEKVGGDFFAELATFKRASTAEAVTARMRRALQAAALNGTGTVRAQIDVDDVIGPAHVEAALALREECAPWIRVQVVVFPQEGVAGNRTAGEVVRRALSLGADVMGGAPKFDPDATSVEHLEICFALAVAHDVDLDIHVDIDTPPDVPLDRWDLWHVARLTAENGWQGRVTVAHLTQHGRLDAGSRAEIVRLLIENGIHLTVVPGAELHTARTWAAAPARRVEEATADWPDLIAHGVRLSYSGGHLADAFHLYGEGDLLRDGLLLAAARNLGDPLLAGCHVLTMATTQPAAAVRLPGPHGVVPGALADLVVLDARDPTTALRHQVDRWLVLHGGRPVARTRTIKELLAR